MAHSQEDLSQGATWEEIIELVEWIESIVETSDRRVEEEARHHSGMIPKGLLESV